MPLTKQQKIVAAVLALAVGAFFVDRWVIGHEDESALVADGAAKQQAGPARRPARPAKPAQGAVAKTAAAAETTSASLGALASRLEFVRAASAKTGQAMNLEDVRDAFKPPSALAGSRKTETVDELHEAARRFHERYKLAAVVLKQAGGGVAVIEDRHVAGQSRSLAVGQKVEGFTLVAVRDRVAILRCGAQRVELRAYDEKSPGVGTSEKVVGVDTAR